MKIYASGGRYSTNVMRTRKAFKFFGSILCNISYVLNNSLNSKREQISLVVANIDAPWILCGTLKKENVKSSAKKKVISNHSLLTGNLV